MIDLRVGHPRTLPHTIVAKACRAGADRLDAKDEAHFPLQYASSSAGTPRFLHQLSHFLSDAYGERVSEQSLMTTNGVSHALDLCVGALSSPGDLAIVEEPTYFLVRSIFLDHGLEVCGVPGDDQGLDTAELGRRLASGTLRPPRLLYIVSTHGNPSGASLHPSRRSELVGLARRYGFHILSDDVYQLLGWDDFPGRRLIQFDSTYARGVGREVGCSGEEECGQDEAYTQAPGCAVGADEREESEGVVISICSFTKILAPGLRLGWIEASPSLLKKIRARGYLVSGGSVAPFAGEIVSEILSSGDQASFLCMLRAQLQERCNALCNALETAGCFRFRIPRGGYFCWVQLPERVTASALLPVAERNGVIFLPGAVCAPTAPSGKFDGFVRICFAYNGVEDICEGVKRLAVSVRELQQGVSVAQCT